MILFEPEEAGEEIRLAAGDERARHIREVLRGKPGMRVRVGIVDGAVGEAEITETGEGGWRCAVLGGRFPNDRGWT